MKTLLIVVFVLILSGMLYGTVAASFEQSVITGAQEIWAHPWGRATLLDTYFAFFAVWLWIASRERSALSRIVWAVLICGLGTFAFGVYFLMRLFQLERDQPWTDIFRPKDAPPRLARSAS